MSKWSTKYWEKRRQLEDLARLKMENDTTTMLQEIFPEALKNIQEKLLAQSDLHKITQAELLADYSRRDQEKYRKYIDQNYKELMESDDKYQEFIDEYFPPYDYAKVNRLLQIRTDIFSELASTMIKKNTNQKFNDHLEDILNRTYNSNINALAYLLGENIHPLPKSELDAIMNYPWSGKTFSNRLWGNVSKLEQRLSKAISESIASGEGVQDVLTTMRGNSEISDMFKLESDKFNRAIENLVRTEYSHFAIEGIKASFKATGVPKGQVWTAEDERVCSICGPKHTQVVETDVPPYHGRCRCTLIPKMAELDHDSIDAEYEALFGDMLNEFAQNEWGVNLSNSKKNITRNNLSPVSSSLLKDLLGSTNMKEMVGKGNYNKFINDLTSQDDPRVRKLFEKYSLKLSFNPIGGSRAYARGNTVQLSQKDFDGFLGKNPLETVYHEIAHAVDYEGLKQITGKNRIPTGNKIKKKVLKKTIELDEYITHASGIPKYNLKDSIKKDLWTFVNANLPRYEDLGKRPRKKEDKLKWDELSSKIYNESEKNFNTFKDKYSKYRKTNPELVHALSDIAESTGYMGEYPFGWGHGKKYWNNPGNVETEFFVHVIEGLTVNPEALDLLKEMFPNSIKIWENIVDDMLKGDK
ncbi:TPA: head protein [Enterococcus faecium]